MDNDSIYEGLWLEAVLRSAARCDACEGAEVGWAVRFSRGITWLLCRDCGSRWVWYGFGRDYETDAVWERL